MDSKTKLKKQAVDDISKILSTFSLKESVEILANVLIIEGISGIEVPESFSFEKAHIANAFFADVEEHGTTLANASGILGLEMLEAINKMRVINE